MKKLVAAAAVIAASASMMFATPAFAASTLASGDTMFAMRCSNGASNNIFTLSSDGSSVGTGSAPYTGDNCFADGAVNPTDGLFYAWDWWTTTFMTVDPTSGIQSTIGDGTFNFNSFELSGWNSILVDESGTIYAIDNYDTAGIYRVTVAATSSNYSTLTLVGTLPFKVTGSAIDPTTGKAYVLAGLAGSVSEVSLTDASVVATYPINCNANAWGLGPADCWGFDIDSAGTMWIATDNGDSDSNTMLASATIPGTNGDSIALIQQGLYTTPGGPWYGSYVLGIIRSSSPSPSPSGPELPNTGSNGAMMGLIALGAFVLIGFGAVMIRRRQA